MRATIVVNLDGPAFGKHEDGKRGALAAALRDLAVTVESYDAGRPLTGTRKVVDWTGATCGRLTVSR